MTFPISTISDAVLKLQQYLADERPMNIQEMRYLHDVLSPFLKSARTLAMNVKPDMLPGYLLNDWITVKGLIG